MPVRLHLGGKNGWLLFRKYIAWISISAPLIPSYVIIFLSSPKKCQDSNFRKSRDSNELSFFKRKLLESWQVHRKENHIENWDVPCIPLTHWVFFSSNNIYNWQLQDVWTDLEFHTVHTRHSHFLHRPVTNLTVCQKEGCWSNIKLYSKLLLKIKCLSTNSKQFKIASK
jgi:hypothetical protein